MQNTTFNMIGVKVPLTISDSENIRLRMSDLGYLDPSLILQTDNSVNVTINKNVYTISSNLHIIQETPIISNDSTITLSKPNFGILEVLVNMEATNVTPAYGELMDYTVSTNVITLNSIEYKNKLSSIKYLSTK